MSSTLRKLVSKAKASVTEEGEKHDMATATLENGFGAFDATAHGEADKKKRSDKFSAVDGASNPHETSKVTANSGTSWSTRKKCAVAFAILILVIAVLAMALRNAPEVTRDSNKFSGVAIEADPRYALHNVINNGTCVTADDVSGILDLSICDADDDMQLWVTDKGFVGSTDGQCIDLNAATGARLLPCDSDGLSLVGLSPGGQLTHGGVCLFGALPGTYLCAYIRPN